MKKPYYLAYEDRYQKVYAAGVEYWGHSSDDEILCATLEKWVEENNLGGKKIIDFACGEGACGMILSKLGCLYHGVDIAPSAVKKAKERLYQFPDAKVCLLDMVKESAPDCYDAALDCMGLHMLVADGERAAYLKNAFGCLKSGAPMLFFRQCHGEDAFDGAVRSYKHWEEICGSDYKTPSLRREDKSGKEVLIPLVPARAKSKEGYIKELQNAGFIVEKFIKMETNSANPYSASIFVRKP